MVLAMQCSGPYTRVFLDKRDARECQRLIGLLEDGNFLVEDVRLPSGNGRTDDFAFDVTLHGPGDDDSTWSLGLAKFLGPKGLLRRTHIYELTIKRPSAPEAAEEAWQGHLFATRLGDLTASLPDNLAGLAIGETIYGLVPRDEAHEVRIDLCTG